MPLRAGVVQNKNEIWIRNRVKDRPFNSILLVPSVCKERNTIRLGLFLAGQLSHTLALALYFVSPQKLLVVCRRLQHGIEHLAFLVNPLLCHTANIRSVKSSFWREYLCKLGLLLNRVIKRMPRIDLQKFLITNTGRQHPSS